MGKSEFVKWHIIMHIFLRWLLKFKLSCRLYNIATEFIYKYLSDLQYFNSIINKFMVK